MAPKKPIKKRPAATTKKSAPKRKKTSSGQGGFFRSTGRFFKSERTHAVLGVLLLALVAYVFLSMLSYFFTGANDKSIFDNLSFKEALQHKGDVKNWFSVMGAYTAETAINDWFGLASFVILFFLTILAVRLLKVRLLPFWKSFFHSFFWLVWGSVFLGYITRVFTFLQPSFFYLGGKHGDYVAGEVLNAHIGIPGTLLLLLAVLTAYLIVVRQETTGFLRGLCKRKERETEFDDDEIEFVDEPVVAVGTEIVPEDWITVPKKPETVETEEKEPKTITPEPVKKSPTTEVAEEVGFEVQAGGDTSEDSNEAGDDEPAYSLKRLGKYDPTLDLSRYSMPSFELLKEYDTDKELSVDMAEQNNNKNRIITTLRNFGIEIESIKATVGPTITLYEIVPKSGIRISKIRNLESDIMLSLAAIGIRIIAPIPGKGTIGIEVPNNEPQIVSMHSVLSSRKFLESKHELPVAFGKTITNEVFMIDLAKMPHLLVAGATGQGKSVGLNAIIASLLYKKHPAQLKFVLIDPKKVEFNIYSAIEKHFLAKMPDGEDAIITDTTMVVQTLNSLTAEMDQRYDLLKKAHVRNIKEYNSKFVNRVLNPEKGHRFLPYIVVVIDEFGDLIMTAGKEVEMPIARIAQLARAVGIHMVIATQRPSVNIITGVIKANFPARVAFRVSSMIDSRTILDAPGANQLVGRGDMLFSQGSELIRVQCAFIDTPEVENVSNFIGQQRGYPHAFYLPEYVGPESDSFDPTSVDMSKRDPLFEEAARMIVSTQQGSTSMIQRKFSIGYNRAGRLADQLEAAGIVGSAVGSKPREVIVPTEYELERILNDLK